MFQMVYDEVLKAKIEGSPIAGRDFDRYKFSSESLSDLNVTSKVCSWQNLLILGEWEVHTNKGTKSAAYTDTWMVL